MPRGRGEGTHPSTCRSEGRPPLALLARAEKRCRHPRTRGDIVECIRRRRESPPALSGVEAGVMERGGGVSVWGGFAAGKSGVTGASEAGDKQNKGTPRYESQRREWGGFGEITVI